MSAHCEICKKIKEHIFSFEHEYIEVNSEHSYFNYKLIRAADDPKTICHACIYTRARKRYGPDCRIRIRNVTEMIV